MSLLIFNSIFSKTNHKGKHLRNLVWILLVLFLVIFIAFLIFYSPN